MIGFRTGTAPSVRVSRSTFGARHMHAIELALEGAGILAQRDRNEWAADRRDLRGAPSFLPSMPRSASTPRMRLALES